MPTKKDTNYRSYYGEKFLTVENEEISPPSGKEYSFSDILKFSICETVLVANVRILGGTENSIDCVRGSNYSILGCSFFGALQGGVVAKGSIEGFTLGECHFGSKSKKFDVELGQYDNYWYPGRPPTRVVTIRNLTTAGGRPVRVMVWDSEMPTVINTNVKITKVPRLIVLLYFYWRHYTRKLFNRTTNNP